MTEKEIVEWIWERAAEEVATTFPTAFSISTAVDTHALIVCRAVAIGCEFADFTPGALRALREAVDFRIGWADDAAFSISAAWAEIYVAIESGAPTELIARLTEQNFAEQNRWRYP